MNIGIKSKGGEKMALTREDLQAIKEIVDDSVSGLKEDTSSLKDRVTRLEVIQENKILPALDEIISYQKSTYDRYNRDADRFEEKINEHDAIVKIVAEHSKQIKELQLKQA